MKFFKDPLRRRKFFKFLLWSITAKLLTTFLMYLIWEERPTVYDFVGSVAVLLVIMYAVDSLRVKNVKAKR